jgi:beta-galactosidase
VFPPTTVFGNLVPDLGSCYDNSNNSFSPISAEPDWKEHNSRAYVAGEFIWTGFDYLGENDWPTISNNDGMIDRCGFPKDIYYFYQSQWTSAPVVHILPHWNWNAGDNYLTAPGGVNIDSSAISGVYSVPVWVYTNCDSVELFLNNVSRGVQRFQSGGALHLAWTVPFAAGTLRAVGRRGGIVAATDSVRTAGTAARIVLTPDKNSMQADQEGLAFFVADITDANGVLCPRAGNPVSFSITGPGTIVGVDNGNSLDHSAYKTNVRQAFNGKCMAIVQMGSTAGAITVTASSGGLTSGAATITATTQTVKTGPGSPVTRTAPECPSVRMKIMNGNSFALPGEAVSLAVYDITGRFLRKDVARTRIVNIKKDFRLPDGVYILEIRR